MHENIYLPVFALQAFGQSRVVNNLLSLILALFFSVKWYKTMDVTELELMHCSVRSNYKDNFCNNGHSF